MQYFPESAIVSLAHFDEVDLGDLERDKNLRIQAILALNGPRNVEFPNGESTDSVVKRAKRGLEHVYDNLLPGEEAVIVTHSILIEVIVLKILEDQRTFRSRIPPNGSIYTVDFQRSRIKNKT